MCIFPNIGTIKKAVKKMSTVVKRQIIILEELQKNVEIPLVQMKNALKWQGATFSKSSFYRDIEFLESVGFVIEKNNGVFKLLKDQSENYDFLSNYFKHLAMSSICQQATIIDKDFLKYIDFDKNANLTYYSLFNQVFEAICNAHPISFTHTSYYFKDQIKVYSLKPYYLKEYKNRWYVVGETEKGFRTFGLDRITNVIVDDTKKIKSKYEEAKENFDFTVGLNDSDHPAEHIRLSFDLSQKPYIESLPIHHTQKVIPNSEKRYIIEVFLTFNLELKQELLKYGSMLKIISPVWIKEDIKHELEQALDNY